MLCFVLILCLCAGLHIFLAPHLVKPSIITSDLSPQQRARAYIRERRQRLKIAINLALLSVGVIISSPLPANLPFYAHLTATFVRTLVTANTVTNLLHACLDLILSFIIEGTVDRGIDLLSCPRPRARPHPTTTNPALAKRLALLAVLVPPYITVCGIGRALVLGGLVITLSCVPDILCRGSVTHPVCVTSSCLVAPAMLWGRPGDSLLARFVAAGLVDDSSLLATKVSNVEAAAGVNGASDQLTVLVLVSHALVSVVCVLGSLAGFVVGGAVAGAGGVLGALANSEPAEWATAAAAVQWLVSRYIYRAEIVDEEGEGEGEIDEEGGGEAEGEGDGEQTLVSETSLANQLVNYAAKEYERAHSTVVPNSNADFDALDQDDGPPPLIPISEINPAPAPAPAPARTSVDEEFRNWRSETRRNSYSTWNDQELSNIGLPTELLAAFKAAGELTNH